MFEKEAEEWWNNEYSPSLYDNVSEVWQRGAEFGYNKANEWHFVKDGDLPKENIYLVIRLNDENTCYKYCTGFWEKEERCFHTLFCNKVDTKDIIAWKEIVLPKEIE
jgi:hypothetical protein